jgi:hypothetical protein
MAKQIDWESERETWVKSVRDLCSRILQWSEEQHWSVHEDRKQVTESRLGTYELPTLMVQAPSGRVHVDPIGRDIVGAHGRVDVFAWPTLHRMLLVRDNGGWQLKTDSSIEWPRRWGKRAFVELVNILTRAE